MLELEIQLSKPFNYLCFLSFLLQFISVLRGKKRKESNRNVEIKEINGESQAKPDSAGNETTSSLPSQPRPAQAPSMANRVEFSRWVRQTVQEQIEWCRKLVDISDSEEEELTCSSLVSLTDLDGPCWTRQEEWKQVSGISRALLLVPSTALFSVPLRNLAIKCVGQCTDLFAKRFLLLCKVELRSKSVLKCHQKSEWIFCCFLTNCSVLCSVGTFWWIVVLFPARPMA